jgi:hypothetical protein
VGDWWARAVKHRQKSSTTGTWLQKSRRRGSVVSRNGRFPQTLRPSSHAPRKEAAHQQQNNHTNDHPSRKVTEVESYTHPMPFRDEQSPVASVEVKDAVAPVIWIVLGKKHAMVSAKQVLSVLHTIRS